MTGEKFILYSTESQVLKVTYLDSNSVSLEEKAVYQWGVTCGKITTLMLRGYTWIISSGMKLYCH